MKSKTDYAIIDKSHYLLKVICFQSVIYYLLILVLFIWRK